MGMLLRFGFEADPAHGEPHKLKPGHEIAPAVRVREAPPEERRAVLVRSIAENLRHLFNTKEGYGWFVPGFGLGNYFAVAAGAEALDALVAEMLENVRKYEPRIADCEIETLGRDVSWIACRLTGLIEKIPHAFEIYFNVTLGQVRVEDG